MTPRQLLRRWLTARNGDTRPAPYPNGGGVAVPLPEPAGAPGGGEGLTHRRFFCSTPGCVDAGLCTFEDDDGQLDHVCPRHCVYCNPGGDIDRAQVSRRLQVMGGSLG